MNEITKVNFTKPKNSYEVKLDMPDDLFSSVLDCTEDGVIIPKVLPWKEYQRYTENQLKLLFFKLGVYVVPTEELCSLLDELISPNENAIEICAGLGVIGRKMNMVCTDSKQQDNPLIQKVYKENGQPTIKYPNYIEKYEALDAVELYKPDCVLACYGTPKWNMNRAFEVFKKYKKEPCGSEYGVDYVELYKRVPHIIAVSYDDLMVNTPLFDIQHKEYQRYGIVVRSLKKLKVYEWKHKI